MKALSIRQPYAWLILHAGKDIENRDWITHYRGPFLIHAGKRVEKIDPNLRDWVKQKLGLDIPDQDDLPRGGIVGRAEIVDVVENSASPWFFGHYGFVLDKQKSIAFTPCKGALGFFKPQI